MNRIQRERDLFLALLNLSKHSDPDPFVEEALRLIVEATGAEHGYMELVSTVEAPDASTTWWAAYRADDEQVLAFRARISSTIINEAMVTGSTVNVPSALLDERFAQNDSVRQHKIEAVLCTPIGAGVPLGVIYLQGNQGKAVFGEEDVAIGELFAQRLEVLVERLLSTEGPLHLPDPTAPFREQLNVGGLIGRSQALADTLRNITIVAPFDVSVLLTGPTGSGKTELANLIHANSKRANKPLVVLNCAAIPSDLFESELFGARKGGHSQADRDIDGKVSAAHEGTLVLDEVGELPLNIQAKLLQFLQSGEFYPLGAKTPVRANVRVISATNVDLEDAVQGHCFRADLMHRLNGFRIRVAGLDQRREDISALLDHFAVQFAAAEGIQVPDFSASARRLAVLTDWPGNVRQLRNAVQAAILRAIADGAELIQPEHLFPAEQGADTGHERPETYEQATLRFQAGLIQRTLEANNWNVAETARQLGIARSHLYTLIRRFNLRRGE